MPACAGTVTTVRRNCTADEEELAGGLVAPVLLYAPATGKDAKLENIRDLKPTFP